MFLIDPEPVRARVASARAEVAVAKARLEEARRQRDRVLPLFEQNAVSQSRRDEAVSGFEVAQANLQAAESQSAHGAARSRIHRRACADLRSDESRSDVRRQPGLDRTGSSLLTKIVQVDPLYVEFSVPEAEAALIRGGLAPANKSAPPPSVKLLLEDGSEYPDSGQVTFVDNAVDRSSGTVRVRAVLRESGSAAASRPVHPREGRRRVARERRVRAAQGRDVERAGPVRLDRRRRQTRSRCVRCRSAAAWATTSS